MELHKETLRGTVARIVGMSGMFLSTVIFARLLSPENFGTAYLLLAVMQVVVRPAGGWSGSVKYYLASGEIDKNEAISSILYFNVIYLFILGAILYAFRSQIRSYFGVEGSSLFLLLLIGSHVFYEGYERIFQGIGRISLSQWYVAAKNYLVIIIQLVFVISGLGVAGFVFGYFWGAVFILSVVIIHHRPIIDWVGFNTVSKLSGYSRSSIPLELVSVAYERLDLILIGYLISTEVTGFYRIALMISMPAIVLSGVLSTGLMTSVSSIKVGEEHTSPLSETNDALSYSSIVAIPIFGGSAVLAPDIVEVVYGLEYISAAPLVIGLSIYRIIQSQSMPIISTLKGMNHPELAAKISMLIIILNIFLGYALAIEFGANGVMFATILSELIRLILCRKALNSIIAGKLGKNMYVVEQFIASGLMVAVIFLVPWQSHQVSVWDLTLLVGGGAITYAMILLLLPFHRSRLNKIVNDEL